MAAWTKRSDQNPPSVDEYISTFPPDVQKKLRQLRKTIRAAAPGAEERISYRMPAYFQNGILVYFAAFEKHIGFFPTPEGIVAFRKELSVCTGGKGSVQFPLEKPLPLALIRKIVAHRVRENRKNKR